MSVPQKILIVEDEADIAGFLRLELEHEGYQVTCCLDGRDALTKALNEKWDLILLDIMLPDINGMEICRRVRTQRDVPIILLTARQSVPEKVAGLDNGADDYIVKPFAIEEVLARIRVLIRRRSHDTNSERLQIDNLELNLATREVTRGGERIYLTAREFDLLEAFMRNSNHVLTRQQLLELVWGYDFAGETNVVDVYVRYLRNKIEVPFGNPLIQTVRGIGYLLRSQKS